MPLFYVLRAFSFCLVILRFFFSLALCVILCACVALQAVFGIAIMLYQYRQLAIVQAIGDSKIIQVLII
jgi:hypothetical protein